MFDFFLIVLSALLVVFLLFLWRRGAIDTTKARDAVADVASDAARDIGKWRDHK